MQTKNLVVWSYNKNIFLRNTGNFKLLKKIKVLPLILLFILLIFSFVAATNFYNTINNPINKNLSVEDFKSDINMLTQIAASLESERVSDKNLQLYNFGSDGKIITSEEINPNLRAFLTNLTTNDNQILEDNITNLKMMRLDQYTFQKKLNEFNFNLSSMDHNLKNYIIITNGKYAGTILYNGPLKFIDSNNKQYFGL